MKKPPDGLKTYLKYHGKELMNLEITQSKKPGKYVKINKHIQELWDSINNSSIDIIRNPEGEERIV